MPGDKSDLFLEIIVRLCYDHEIMVTGRHGSDFQAAIGTCLAGGPPIKDDLCAGHRLNNELRGSQRRGGGGGAFESDFARIQVDVSPRHELPLQVLRLEL